MAKVLMLYGSIDGQTKKICLEIERCLREGGDDVVSGDVIFFSKTLKDYDKIILASSIRYGKHHPKILSLIEEESEFLNKIKSVFISVNLVARKPEKRTKETNPYVSKFFRRSSWSPNLIGIFAGALDYSRYSFWDKYMIKLIMIITKGPVFSNLPIEYTDWDQVRDFADEIKKL